MNKEECARLYRASRNTKYPLTLKDISDLSGIKRKDIARAYRKLVLGK